MADITLQFVNSFYDARGKLRHVFRRKGHKRVSLPGSPGSAIFMEAYQALLENTGGSPAALEIGARRTKAGTIDAVVVAYLRHESFTKGLAEATQNMRRPILDHFREFLTPSGRRYGGNNIATLQSAHIMAVLEGKSRAAQKNWLKTLRGLMAFAVAQGLRLTDPSRDLKPVKGPKSSGHMTWLEPQVAQYRERHALGTVARLALELMLNIAARRYDAHALGRQHMTEGKLVWRPHKTLRSTGKLLKVRVIPEFKAALDAMPQAGDGVLNFLVNDYGRAFASAAAFGNKFADWCKAAGLKPVQCDDGKVRSYRAHGLRKAALRALAHAGCTGSELMQVSGHSSLDQVQPYIDEVEQERMADNAMDKLAVARGQKGGGSHGDL